MFEYPNCSSILTVKILNTYWLYGIYHVVKYFIINRIHIRNHWTQLIKMK